MRSANRFPDGYGTGLTRSVWPFFDSFTRRMLVAETLAANPTWEPDGVIDFEDPKEPLFREWESGRIVTLLGEVVTSEPLSIEITRGNLIYPVPARKPQVPGQNLTLDPWIIAAILGVLIIAATSRR